MNANEKLKQIENDIADAKTYMGNLNWKETGINGEDIEWLIARIKRLESGIECVIDRYVTHGDDARKHGVSLGLYTVCKNILEDK